jgi:L,D-transpeptidase YcbB
MRRPSLVTILGAAGALALAVLTIWFLAGTLSATDHHASSIVVHIPDNPVDEKSDATDAVVAALPDVSAPQTAQPESPLPEEPAPVAEEPPPPKNAAIVETIRVKLKDADLRKDANADDLAALEAFYAERNDPSLWMTEEGFSEQAQAVLDELGKAEEWGLSSQSFSVPSAATSPSTPDAQAIAEIELDLAILKYARFAKGGRTTPTALSKVIDQQLALPDPKIVMTEIAAADAPDDYLKSLHPKHEQFQKLREALAEAREEGAKDADIERLVINMERWRWMPDDLGPRYVQINVPEFMAFIVKDGKTVYEDKVVVGKAVYATPIFSADMTSIVFNPEWTVPPTVIREDLLPHLRAGGGWFSSSSNLAVLKRHKLKVRYNGRPVDPSKIDWKKVNMRAISFHQPPGPTNVLGKVKFLYPNVHAVYMHDTIKKGQMDKEVRVEGHHCPRVANPGKFAGVLLAEDQNMTEEQIDKLMATGHDRAVEIKTPIPVHTTYFTAVVDEEGEVKTFGDIYKLDAVVTKALAPDLKAVVIAAKPVSPEGDEIGLPHRKPAASGALADSTP